MITEADVEMQRLIESQVESHKIGSAIAEEALHRSSAEFSPDLPADLLQDAVFNQNVSQSVTAAVVLRYTNDIYPNDGKNVCLVSRHRW